MLVRGAQLETERLSLLRVVFQQQPLEESFPLPSKRHRRTVWGTFQRAEKGEVQRAGADGGLCANLLSK
jgi:hypothetical protein